MLLLLQQSATLVAHGGTVIQKISDFSLFHRLCHLNIEAVLNN
jgi:hypothetical protein